MKKSTDRQGIVTLRAMAGIAAIVLLPVLLYAGAPDWWTSRHVTSGTASDYATVNAGQLKNMATAAFNELQANLPGGVGNMTAPSGTFPRRHRVSVDRIDQQLEHHHRRHPGRNHGIEYERLCRGEHRAGEKRGTVILQTAYRGRVCQLLSLGGNGQSP